MLQCLIKALSSRVPQGEAATGRRQEREGVLAREAEDRTPAAGILGVPRTSGRAFPERSPRSGCPVSLLSGVQSRPRFPRGQGQNIKPGACRLTTCRGWGHEQVYGCSRGK